MYLDSDCIITQKIDVADFLVDGRPIVWKSSYASITPEGGFSWQEFTSKVIGQTPTHEYMRRFPFLYLSTTLIDFADYIKRTHGKHIDRYIQKQAYRQFSEFNAIGFFAELFHNRYYEFIDTDAGPMPESHIIQFWSWGGISPEIKAKIDEALKGNPVRKTKHGFYVLDGDTHIGKWSEESGRLDHDQNMLPSVLKHIKEGDTVIDAGAYIGDHTIAYSRVVGTSGNVIAIEANQDAFNCLELNMASLSNVKCYNTPLGTGKETVSVTSLDPNFGTAFLKEGEIKTISIDGLKLKECHFIKIDCEGYEPLILQGGAKTIKKHKPTLLIEVNDGALKRYGSSREALIKQVEELGYSVENIYKEQGLLDEQFDIICKAKA
jgi:FkbM family methyltransferase